MTTIGLTQFAYGLISYLTNTLTLQVHILCYLCHGFVFLTDAEESIHHPTLTFIEDTKCKLYGILDSFRVNTLIGKWSVMIDEDGKQTHVSLMAQGGVNTKRLTLQQGSTISNIAGYLIETSLLGNSFLDMLTDVYHSIIYKACSFRGVEVGGSFHKTDVAFAHKVVHSKPFALILGSNSNNETEVSLHQPV